MSRCTLLVDGNWLLRSRKFAVEDKFAVGLDDYTPGFIALKQLLSQSLIGMINALKIVDDVIIVRDGGSWRKKLEKPKTYCTAYKANRKLSEQDDWSQIWKAYEEWCNQCKNIGMTVSHEFDAEGDDWIAYWSNNLSNKGNDVIIWSTDHDLQQLVTLKDDGTFVAWYEKSAGLVLHKRADKRGVLPLDFFLMPEDSGNMIWLKENILKIDYIEPSDIIMEKIICGDAGDNILSIIVNKTTTAKGKPKTNKVTVKDWNTVKDELCINYLNFISSKNQIINNLLEMKRYSGYDFNTASDMFDFNIKLVTLSMDVIPQYLFEKAEHKNFDINNIKHNYRALSGIQDDVSDLVEELPF